MPRSSRSLRKFLAKTILADKSFDVCTMSVKHRAYDDFTATDFK